MTTLYGIANCDTVRKARRWLKDQGIEHSFHDFRKDGLTAEQVAAWHEQVGDALLNRRGTTWRGLTDEQKASVDDAAALQALLVDQPTLIKRPVLDNNGQISIGFKDAHYQELFA